MQQENSPFSRKSCVYIRICMSIYLWEHQIYVRLSTRRQHDRIVVVNVFNRNICFSVWKSCFTNKLNMRWRYVCKQVWLAPFCCCWCFFLSSVSCSSLMLPVAVVGFLVSIASKWGIIREFMLCDESEFAAVVWTMKSRNFSRCAECACERKHICACNFGTNACDNENA